MIVNGARLWERLQRLGCIGADEHGGVTRPGFGRAHAEALALVPGWARDAGLDTGRDDSGNLIAVLPGTDTAAPLAGLGSHLDSVPNGGRFDGALGVLAALEVLQTLREHDARPGRGLAMLGLADEEGNTFGIGVMSAQLWIGEIPPDRYSDVRDPDGLGLDAYLRAFDVPCTPIVDRPALAAYLELHVEQGPVLDEACAPAAAVEAIVGISRSTATFVGQANHAGTTPMARRRDALWGGAELALRVRDLAIASDTRAVATVGVFEVSPGVTNVVPGSARLRIELRSPDEGLLTDMRDEIERIAVAIAGRPGLDVEIEPWHHAPTVRMHPVVLQATQRALGDAGLPKRTMPSWAGHDAKVLARRIPVGMLFVPSKGGLSHTPGEDTDPSHCAAGAQALLHAALRLADDADL